MATPQTKSIPVLFPWMTGRGSATALLARSLSYVRKLKRVSSLTAMMFASGSTATSVKTGKGSCTPRIGATSPPSCEKRNSTAGPARRNRDVGKNRRKRVRISTSLLLHETARSLESGAFAVRIAGHGNQLLEVRLGQFLFPRLRRGLPRPSKRSKAVWHHAKRTFKFPKSFGGLIRCQQQLTEKFTHWRKPILHGDWFFRTVFKISRISHQSNGLTGIIFG